MGRIFVQFGPILTEEFFIRAVHGLAGARALPKLGQRGAAIVVDSRGPCRARIDMPGTTHPM